MIRKTWWMAAGLAFFLGCAEEGTEGGNALPLPPAGGGVTAPSPPPVSSGSAGVSENPTAPTAPGDATTPAPGGSTDTPAPTPTEPPKAGDAPKSADTGADAALTEEEIAQIKKLPESDQALALLQKLCPISGEHLGEMGVPVKVTAGGQSAFLCCKGCMDDFNKDPEGTLAKAKKK
jgi:hypothetical protein